MRKLLFIGAICALTASTALALPTHGDGYYGGRIYYNRFAGYYSGDGGEFTIRSDGTPGLLLSNAAYDSKTRGVGGYSESFQTFCMEIREYVAEPMDVWVSTAWANGTNKPQWDTSNDHFPQSHSWKGGTRITGDDLNPQTAYLYYQFATGNLQSYDYSPGSARATDAGQLQRAIWFLEGELTSLNSYNQAKSWVQEAVNATGLAFGTYTPSGSPTWGNTIGPVRVLQMYWVDGCGRRLKQDQLYLTIPAPGAVLLGSIGVAFVGWLRRRRTL